MPSSCARTSPATPAIASADTNGGALIPAGFGTLRQDDVTAALDHAELAEGPGGPAAVVPGQHHLRMNMYIAQARGGRFEIVRALGPIDPQERLVPSSVAAR